MYIHDLDPIIFNIGPLALRWYSLAYIISFILGFYYILFLVKKYSLKITNKKDLEDLIFQIICGVIIGGRLGYVLFYNFGYYFNNLLEIFYIWQGGMSFHGGMIGFTLAVLFHAKKLQKPFLAYMDILALAVPIGLFFGRIANFINGELYGRVTSVKWAVIFPEAGLVARHPTQLYEAFFEGLVAFIILYYLYSKAGFRAKSGKIAGSFLVIYSVSRIFVEFFRVADSQIGYFFNIFTMGQILSLPMFCLGIYLIFYHGQSSKQKN
ncbi:MAG: prolipoprotein diacylglyceryl transferase [Rickettsiales bacterium]